MQKVNLSSWQVFTMTFCFCAGTTIIILPGIILREGKQLSYLLCLCHLIFGLIIALLWLYLSKRNPGKSLIQIISHTLGKWVGGFICLLYVGFFIQIASWVTKNLTDFIHINTMPKTPIIVFTIVILFLSSYSALKGVESIAKVSEILFMFGVLAFYIPLSFMFTEWDWTNFRLPHDYHFYDTLIKTRYVTAIPYMETIIFLMVFPNVSRGVKFGYLSGMIFGGLLFAITIFFTIGILGIERCSHLIYPLYTMFREIRLSFFFEHLESILAINIFLFVIFKLSVIVYATVLAICQVFNINKREVVSYPLIWIIAGYSLVTNSVVENVYFIEKYLFSYYLPFTVYLPILLILGTWYKQKKFTQIKGIKNNYD